MCVKAFATSPPAHLPLLDSRKDMVSDALPASPFDDLSAPVVGSETDVRSSEDCWRPSVAEAITGALATIARVPTVAAATRIHVALILRTSEGCAYY